MVNRNNEVLERHSGSPGTLELVNDDGSIDTLPIHVLPYPELHRLWRLIMSSSDPTAQTAEDNKTAMINMFNDENMEPMNHILYWTVKQAFPDSDDELINKFISKNCMELLTKIIEVNVPSAGISGTKSNPETKLINKIKKK